MRSCHYNFLGLCLLVMPQDVQLPDSSAVLPRGSAALSKDVSGSQAGFPDSQLGCRAFLSSGIVLSNQAAHSSILHSYFTAAVTEFFLIRIDHKRKKNTKKENIKKYWSVFFSSLTSQGFEKCFWQWQHFCTTWKFPWETNLLRKTFILQGFTSPQPCFLWVIRAKDREKRVTGETSVLQGREDLGIPFVLLYRNPHKPQHSLWFLGTLRSVFLNTYNNIHSACPALWGLPEGCPTFIQGVQQHILPYADHL